MSLDKIIAQDDVGSVDHVLESQTNNDSDNQNYRRSIVRGGDGSASRACIRCGALVQVADFGLHDDFHIGLQSDQVKNQQAIEYLSRQLNGLANNLNLAHELIDMLDDRVRRRYNQIKNMNTVAGEILPRGSDFPHRTDRW